MRYVIGARVPNNDGVVAEGLYVISKYGLPWIATKKTFQTTTIDNERIMVFESIQEIEDYIKGLRKAYYKEFHDRAKRYNLDIRDFRFFPLKLDSYKMKCIKLGEQSWTKDRKHKVYRFKVDREILG